MGKGNILHKRWYLYLTEFFSGMAVMAVELGASRLLAPYFSSSQIVWTIIIGTIMIAMALGNLYGGRTADRDNDPAKLYRRILIAAVWIAAIPLVGKYIILAITGLLVVTVNIGFLIWASFLACMILFVFPLFLLGTVTPSLVKYSTESLDESGRIVGTLGAWNTIGSILGTFLPTFVTIPAVGTAVTFLLFSGILLVISILYFLSSGGKKTGVIVSAVIFIFCSIFGNSDRFAFWERGLTYEGESVYNYLQVRDSASATILSTNVLFGVQSVHMKGGDLTGMYYDYALAAPVLAGFKEKENPSALVLGMGTGTWAMQVRDFFPGAQLLGVEIDEDITALARKYFELDGEIPVVTYDGRAYLQSVDETYDCIMVDAYRDITIPFSMSSVEFFTLVRDHLKPDGVMVVNMNMHSDEAGGINEQLSDTIAQVFDSVMTVDVPASTNRELFAGKDLTPEALRAAAEELKAAGIAEASGDAEEMQAEVGTAEASGDAEVQVAEAGNLRRGSKQASLEKTFSGTNATPQEVLEKQSRLADKMLAVADRSVLYEGGDYLLTDDQAPVELLGMRVIDSLIRDELGYYKKAFQENGIRGLLGVM